MINVPECKAYVGLIFTLYKNTWLVRIRPCSWCRLVECIFIVKA